MYKYGNYGNRITEYNGQKYHSKKEAEYARELDLRVKAKDLKEWKSQVPIKFIVNGQKICTYKIDFIEIAMDGEETYTEIKGFETSLWRLKWKIFCALYPDLKKQIIK